MSKKTKVVRAYHPWWKWECYKAGFFNTTPPNGMDADQAREAYREFLSDLSRFGAAMDRVIKEWPHSCEQFLTNHSFNRVAWLGQASMCIATGVPSIFRGGYKLLTPEQQVAADNLAQTYLERWIDEYRNKGSKIYRGLEGKRVS